MRCDIYVRRSTEEHQVASLDVQIEEATRYVTSKGWTVAPEHVYRDDAVSRTEFKKRPGLIAMLNAVKDRAFDAIVFRDDSRLGGDYAPHGLVVQDIVEGAVRLFCYFEDREITLDGATDKIMMALRGYAAELEREKLAGRTREHLMTKARRGLNTGGRCVAGSLSDRSAPAPRRPISKRRRAGFARRSIGSSRRWRPARSRRPSREESPATRRGSARCAIDCKCCKPRRRS